MPINFFSKPCTNPAGNCLAYSIECLDTIDEPKFGITDEDGGNSTPARVDTVDSAIWDLTVINNSGTEVYFKAVDWCVPIYRTGSYDLNDENRDINQFSSDITGLQLIKRCEGFLHYNQKIVFIEIKKRPKRPSEWITDARAKFEETILSFKEHHPNLINQIQKPILVNTLHTGVATNEMVQKRILKDKIGVDFIRLNELEI